MHLCIVISPASLNIRIHFLGLLPAVSTIFTPSSMMTLAYSSYGGGGPIVGRMVRLTPNGFLVNFLSCLIHSRPCSGEPALWMAINPSPPAFDTAAASSGVPTP